MQERKLKTPGKSQQTASIDWKPNAHTALGPGIEPEPKVHSAMEQPVCYALALAKLLVHLSKWGH